MFKGKCWRWLLLLLPVVAFGLWWHHYTTSGPHIVFVAEHRGISAIYSMNVNGCDVRPLTHADGAMVFPISLTVSPDRKKIAYSVLGSCPGAIRVMDTDGKHDHQIAAFNGPRVCIFSADSKTIYSIDLGDHDVFRNSIEGHIEKQYRDCVAKLVCNPNCREIYTTCGSCLYRSNVDSSDKQEIVRYGVEDIASSPDGNRIYYKRYDEIYRANNDGKQVVKLTKNPGLISNLFRYPQKTYHVLAVSPDGKLIAFIAEINNHLQIFLMDTDGNHSRQLTNESKRLSNLSFSPDSQMILYTLFDDEPSPEDICTIRIDGSHRKVLTHTIEAVELRNRIKSLLPLSWMNAINFDSSTGIHAYPSWLPERKR